MSITPNSITMRDLIVALLSSVLLSGCVDPQVKPEEFWNQHLERIQPEITELKEREAAAKKAKENLSRFDIAKSTFEFTEGSYRMEPVIRLSVTNGTVEPIARVYMKALMVTPGRSVPWLETSMNYQIPGGLEPGESAEWTLEPSRISDWWNLPRDRDDMILMVEVIGLEGPNDTPLWDAKFTERDQERLTELLAILDRIETNLDYLTSTD